MLVPQAWKEFMDFADSVGIMAGFLAAVGAGIRMWITRERRSAAGKQAVEQVHKMATNDLPHLFEESVKTNNHLERQTVLLQDMRDGIIKLVDRTPRA